MPCLPWDASLSVGVPALDEQHRAFIQVLNELHEILIAGEFRDVLLARERTLAGIDQYISTHFPAEEEYMAGFGYPFLAEHRRLHEQFAAQVRRYHTAIAGGELVLNSELVKTMINWAREHLATEDRKYANFVAGLG